jgi:radical SAM protein with 4Fe4S-binding SPASM domain
MTEALKDMQQKIRSTKRLAQILWSYRMAQSRTVPYPPYRLWVEPTAVCNLRCSYCPNKVLSRQQKLGFMSYSLFQKVIDEARDWVHDINVHHRGEALLHPQFTDMVNYAGTNGVFTKLHTNATRLTHEMSEAILDSSLDLISFSFDGFDKATYERYRPPANFEGVLDNILGFLRLKEQSGQRKPFTIIETIDFPDAQGGFGPEKRRAFLNQFEGLPVDRFVLKKPHNWGGNVTLDGDIQAGDFTPCTFLWHSLVVMWDGKVGPCPHDYMGKIVFGDASSQDLASIFNSPLLSELRESMIRRQLPEWLPCNKCDTVRRKRVLGLPLQSFRYLQH